MRKKVDMKPKKCWNCAYLGKCELLEPCSKFKEYHYDKSIDTLSIRKIANQIGMSDSTLRKYLKQNQSLALKVIKDKTGYDYIYDYTDKKKKYKEFILI